MHYRKRQSRMNRVVPGTSWTMLFSDLFFLELSIVQDLVYIPWVLRYWHLAQCISVHISSVLFMCWLTKMPTIQYNLIHNMHCAGGGSLSFAGVQAILQKQNMTWEHRYNTWIQTCVVVIWVEVTVYLRIFLLSDLLCVMIFSRE